MVIPSGLLTVQNVKMAAVKWRKHPGYGGFHNPLRYEVKIDGRGYPVKAIVAIALEIAGQGLLSPADFPGRRGGRWHTELEALGFEIRNKQGEYEPVHNYPSVRVIELLSIVTNLGAPVVITKNKSEVGEENFCIDPTNSRRWLDGVWEGVPQDVEPKSAFVLHWVVHRSVVCIGRYLGTRSDGGRRNFLVLDRTHFYSVEDMEGDSEAHARLHAILKQSGPVTYSYYRPSVITREETPEQREARFRIAQARMEQPAFRRAVLALHGGKCVVTQCATEALLDAAHLPGRDWRLGHNEATDGIPLRVDVHRALDQNLIKLNDRHQLIETSPDLHGIYDEHLVKSRRGSRD